MGQKNKTKTMGYLFIGLVVVVLAVVTMSYSMNNSTQEQSATTDAIVKVLANNCPDDGDTSFKLDVHNPLNETGSENYDVTYYILGDDGSVVDSGTDTTTPDVKTIDCGQAYKLVVISADGASGDNSVIKSILAKPSGSDAKIVDGALTFTADRSNLNLKIGVDQHGTLKFKAYDNEDAIYAYDSGDADNTAWETDGITYTDGDNATAYAVSSGGFLDFVFKIKGNEDDTDAMDKYMLIAIEAPVTAWNEPSVKWNGQLLTDVSDSDLTSFEDKALSGYEYVYKITDAIKDDIHEMDFYMETCSGCDPTADVEVDFFPAGNYLSTNGVEVLTGASKDDSSNTAVFTTQDITIDVS